MRTIVTIVCVSALALGAPASRAQNYLTDLGAVAPALGINNSGQVVLQGYLYSSGTLTAFPANFTGAAINSSGVVAGGDSTTSLGATYSNGSVVDLPGATGQALGINDSGAIVGTNASGVSSGSNPSAWLYSGGVTTEIPWLNWTNIHCLGVTAQGINDSGQITGSARSPTATFCIEPLGPTDTYVDVGGSPLTDLGPGIGYAINASGQVAGITYTSIEPLSPPGCECQETGPVAALFSNGTVTILPGGAGVAYAINAIGFIVGDGVNGTTDAFFYNGVTSDLNALVLPADPLQPYVTLTDARGINDNGLIVVNGIDSRTQAQHAYLLQVPLIEVNPTAFPAQAIGTTSTGQSVTLTNVGTTAVAFGDASIATGPFAIQSNTCVGSLAPAASCAITLTFTPTAPGTPSAVLTITAGGSPLPITVSGVTPLVITSFTPSATTIVANTGLNLTLSWAASNPAASCMGSGGGWGDEWANGSTRAASGTVQTDEIGAGTLTFVLTCTVGSETATAQTVVVVVWPVVTAALSASAPSVLPQQAVTLKWSASNAAQSCVASGGGTGDGWAGSALPTSGSKVVTEPTVPAAGKSATLTFTVTCKPGVREYPGSASVKVVQMGPSVSASSGGGAFDPLSVVCLVAIAALCRRRRACGRS